MSSRPNRILALLGGGLVVIAVIAAVVAATRSAPTYDPDTPEGVVQAYLTAVIDGERSDAIGYLAESRCTEEDFEHAYLPDRARVVLRDSEAGEQSATVDVEVVFSSGSFLEPEYSEEQTFRLTKSGDEWRITGEPWPLFECGLGF